MLFFFSVNQETKPEATSTTTTEAKSEAQSEAKSKAKKINSLTHEGKPKDTSGTSSSVSNLNLLRKSLSKHRSPDKLLIIYILKGENLEHNSTGANPFVKITVKNSKGGKVTYQTKAKRHKANPNWTNETFQFISPTFPIQCSCLSSNSQKAIKNEHKSRPKPTLLGTCEIHEDDVNCDRVVQTWFPLKFHHPIGNNKVPRILLGLMLTDIKM